MAIIVLGEYKVTQILRGSFYIACVPDHYSLKCSGLGHRLDFLVTEAL